MRTKNIKLSLSDQEKKLKEAFSSFLNTPTEKNLRNFLRIAQSFKDLWIEEQSEVNKSNIKGLDDIWDQGVESVINDLSHAVDFSEGAIKVSEREIKKFINARMKSTKLFEAKSDDGNLKILTSSVYLNLSPNLELEIIYNRHGIRDLTYNEKSGRLMNRRWYISKEKDNKSIQKPWSSDRFNFDSLIHNANNMGMFSSRLNDKRIKEYSTIFSNSLDTKEEYLKFYNEISFPNERDNFIERGDGYFIIFEAKYNKAPYQYASYLENAELSNWEAIDSDIEDEEQSKTNLPKQATWRDVCIFTSSSITFRSFTDDKTFVPGIIIPGNEKWILSNDMPQISNQAFTEFLKVTNPKLKINEE